MEKAQMLDKKEISRQRNAVIKHIKKNHTITNYRNSFEESLKQIINL
jgi:predicted small metal-binding protein